MVPIPKAGYISKGGNYCGIALGSIVLKTYNRMIPNRIRPDIDYKLRTNQNQFRKGRTIISQILVLRKIIEDVKKFKLKAIITFIDFSKAFDTIHCGQMLKILCSYGVPGQLVNAIKDMYSNTQAKVLMPHGDTKPFQVTSGVLQGDTVAPYLFIIVLDYVLWKAMQGREEELGFCLKK